MVKKKSEKSLFLWTIYINNRGRQINKIPLGSGRSMDKIKYSDGIVEVVDLLMEMCARIQWVKKKRPAVKIPDKRIFYTSAVQ